MKPTHYKLGVGLILTLGLLLRLIGIQQSFWLDEAAQAIESSRTLSQQLDIIPDFQPPLFHLWVHLFTYVDNQEWWLRLASLLPGLITLWLCMVLAKRLFDEKTALLAGLLLATSQFHLYFSQELRPYSFATMWALVSCYCFFKLLQPTAKKPTQSFAVGYVLSLVAGLYSVYTFPFLILSHAITAGYVAPKKLGQLGLYWLIASLAVIPWLPRFWLQLQAGITLAQQNPIWANAVSLPLYKAIPLTWAQFTLGKLPVNVTTLSLLPLLVAGVVMIAILPHIFKDKQGKTLLLLGTTPILIAFLISFVIPVLEPKRLLYCLPILTIVIAAGVVKSKFSTILATVLLLLNGLAMYRYATEPDLQREPWRQAIQTLESQLPASTPVIFAFPEPFAPWLWYQRANLPTISFAGVDLNDRSALDQKLKPLQLESEVVVFEYLMDVSDPHRKIQNWLQQYGYREIGMWQYPGIGKIIYYGKDPKVAEKL